MVNMHPGCFCLRRHAALHCPQFSTSALESLSLKTIKQVLGDRLPGGLGSPQPSGATLPPSSPRSTTQGFQCRPAARALSASLWPYHRPSEPRQSSLLQNLPTPSPGHSILPHVCRDGRGLAPHRHLLNTKESRGSTWPRPVAPAALQMSLLFWKV